MAHFEDTQRADGLLDPAGFPSSRPVSPLRLFVITVVLVFTAELLIMFWLEIIWQAPEVLEVFLDSIVLAVVVTPVLYWTLYRPLNRYVLHVKMAGEALLYSEKKYQTVVEHSPAGVFMVREDTIVFANRRMAEILGRDGPTLVGTQLGEVVLNEDQAQVTTLLHPTADAEGVPQESEFRVRQPGGHIRWVSARSTMVRYKGADSVLGMVLDITRRKVLAEEVRLLSAQRLHLQEEERARLARELHDGVGQSLSGIKFLVEHTLGQSHPNERREQMESLRALVPKLQDTVEDVRRMSMALRPSTLDDLGLIATVTWFLRELQASCPHIRIAHRLEVAEAQVPEPLKIVIYRTLQEALNNAAKHCGNCTVEVVLEWREGQLRLEVCDDGDGFDVEEVIARDPATRGFGLASMRERAELSGGEFTLSAAPGGGTRVQTVWPVGGPQPTN
ncbi:MAG TPA: PAS domain-containing sensor histidine kinase [Deferrisomatales bacterium]|nr:PAS domain-containing sensor histidine kinase [Deferrisomatales bacterium]